MSRPGVNRRRHASIARGSPSRAAPATSFDFLRQPNAVQRAGNATLSAGRKPPAGLITKTLLFLPTRMHTTSGWENSSVQIALSMAGHFVTEAIRDHHDFVVQRIVDIGQAPIGAGGGLIDLGRTLHAQGFIRALVVEMSIKSSNLACCCKKLTRPGGSFFNKNPSAPRRPDIWRNVPADTSTDYRFSKNDSGGCASHTSRLHAPRHSSSAGDRDERWRLRDERHRPDLLPRRDSPLHCSTARLLHAPRPQESSSVHRAARGVALLTLHPEDLGAAGAPSRLTSSETATYLNPDVSAARRDGVTRE